MNEHARFLAYAKPYSWHGDKAPMDLAWMVWCAAVAAER